MHKSFQLLSRHTNIPLTKKVCRLSETQKILKENIFPELFIYFSSLAHTTLAVFICLTGADIQDSSMCDFFLNFFFICSQRRRQGRGLARRRNINPAVCCVSLASLCALQQQWMNKNPYSSVFQRVICIVRWCIGRESVCECDSKVKQHAAF